MSCQHQRVSNPLPYNAKLITLRVNYPQMRIEICNFKRINDAVMFTVSLTVVDRGEETVLLLIASAFNQYLNFPVPVAILEG